MYDPVNSPFAVISRKYAGLKKPNGSIKIKRKTEKRDGYLGKIMCVSVRCLFDRLLLKDMYGFWKEALYVHMSLFVSQCTQCVKDVCALTLFFETEALNSPLLISRSSLLNVFVRFVLV